MTIDQFLEALIVARTEAQWAINRISGCIGGFYQDLSTCTTTTVVANKQTKKRKFKLCEWVQAGKQLGLSEDDLEKIAQAEENHVSQDRRLRRKMIAALGLVETNPLQPRKPRKKPA